MGTTSNRDAVGARVTAGRVDLLTVRWPRSGIVQTFRDVAGGRIVEVTEGRHELVEKVYGGAPR